MQNDNLKNILIIEDELVIANVIKITLEDEGFNIIGIVSDMEAALSLYAQCLPELIISDINLKIKETGIDIVQKLFEIQTCKVIFLSAYNDELILQHALDLKPITFITKPFNDKQLITAVKMAFFSHNQNAVARVTTLSDREREIARLIIDGKSSREIASLLYISDKTVNTHRREIKKKLNINSISDWYDYKPYL